MNCGRVLQLQTLGDLCAKLVWLDDDQRGIDVDRRCLIVIERLRQNM
jgi:hypothetical protein